MLRMYSPGRSCKPFTCCLRILQHGEQIPTYRVSSFANCSDWVVNREGWNFKTRILSGANLDLPFGVKKQKKTWPPELTSMMSPVVHGRFCWYWKETRFTATKGECPIGPHEKGGEGMSHVSVKAKVFCDDFQISVRRGEAPYPSFSDLLISDENISFLKITYHEVKGGGPQKMMICDLEGNRLVDQQILLLSFPHIVEAPWDTHWSDPPTWKHLTLQIGLLKLKKSKDKNVNQFQPSLS